MSDLLLNVVLLLMGGFFLWLLVYSFLIILFPRKNEQKNARNKWPASKR